MRYYEFGDYKLDLRKRVLTRRGSPVALTNRNFELLLVLVENQGRILSHDELLEKVWEGQFVEQSNLKKGIWVLRNALEESASESEFIRTIPRKGYSFIAHVNALPDTTQTKTVSVNETEPEIFAGDAIEKNSENGSSPKHRIVAVPVENTASAVATSNFRSRLIILGFGVLLFFGVFFAVWSFFSRRPPVRFSVENVRVEKLTTDGNCFGTISPDGNFIVCGVRDKNNSTALEVQQLATGSRRRLISYQNASFYAYHFSPDSDFVYFIVHTHAEPEKSGLYKIPFLGGEPQRLTGIAGSFTVSPDGARLIFTRDGENGSTDLIMITVNGDDERLVRNFPNNFRLWDFRFAPDGASLLYAVRKQISSVKNVFYVSEFSFADGTERILVPERETMIVNALWSPDKQSLLLSLREQNADRRQIWQLFPSTGEQRRVTNDDNSYRFLSLTRDGKTLVAVQESVLTTIWMSDDESLNFRQLLSGLHNLDHVFWTPDGRLGFSSTENRAEAIWLMSADGKNKQRLTDGKDDIWLQPRLSGDGKSVVFRSNRSGLGQLWRVGLDGKNLTQLTRSETPVFNGALLSDHQTVIYKTFLPGKGWFLFRQSADGKTALITEKSNTGHWDISPDERFIAYSAADTNNNNKIFVQPLENGVAPVKIFDVPKGSISRQLRWTRDAKALVFDLTIDGKSELMRQPLNGGEPKTFTDFRSENIYWCDWSFDGTRLAVIRGKALTDTVQIKAE